MKIKDFRKPTTYQFMDIDPGTVFAREETLCMAIEPIKRNDLGVEFNAVNLETGELVRYLDSDFIQLVNAELCVR